jgi:hypothetical protein
VIEVQAVLMLAILAAPFIAMQFVGIVLLSLTYTADAEYNQYSVPMMYAFKWVLITGLPGYITSGDKENGLFWRHIKVCSDAARTNAGDIASCKTNLCQLERLPRTAAILRAIATEKEKLQILRAHDNNVASAIGVGVLAPDLMATCDGVAASHVALEDARRPPLS